MYSELSVSFSMHVMCLQGVLYKDPCPFLMTGEITSGNPPISVWERGLQLPYFFVVHLMPANVI